MTRRKHYSTYRDTYYQIKCYKTAKNTSHLKDILLPDIPNDNMQRWDIARLPKLQWRAVLLATTVHKTMHTQVNRRTK